MTLSTCWPRCRIMFEGWRSSFISTILAGEQDQLPLSSEPWRRKDSQRHSPLIWGQINQAPSAFGNARVSGRSSDPVMPAELNVVGAIAVHLTGEHQKPALAAPHCLCGGGVEPLPAPSGPSALRRCPERKNSQTTSAGSASFGSRCEDESIIFDYLPCQLNRAANVVEPKVACVAVG